MDPSSLENLHDIIVPAPSPWLPPAPGWYALAVSVLLLITWLLVGKYIDWQHNRYRREALRELGRFEKKLADASQYHLVLPQLTQLVKRTAIAAYGKAQVASLNGVDWLTFLDKTCLTDLFTKGDGQLLNDCSYQTVQWFAKLSSEQIRCLCKAVYFWINKHRPAMNKTNKVGFTRKTQ